MVCCNGEMESFWGPFEEAGFQCPECGRSVLTKIGFDPNPERQADG